MIPIFPTACLPGTRVGKSFVASLVATHQPEIAALRRLSTTDGEIAVNGALDGHGIFMRAE